MATQQEKCESLRALHQGDETFVIPNPWDVGSARLLEGMGFKALATTSAGFAISIGRQDGQVTLDEKLKHCRALAAVTEIPVSADFENGFADDAADVADNIAALIQTGLAGCSVEDFSRDTHEIYDRGHATERIRAAREAIDNSGLPFQLTARAENLIRGVRDLDDTVSRLQAYSEAGADVLYAPGISSLDNLAQVTGQLDKPFNVLGVMIPGASVADFQAAGAIRVSVGNALTSLVLKPLLDAGDEMMQQGTFSWTARMVSGKRLAELLS